MALKAVVENVTEIPEALRGEYEQRDGKYVLKLEGAPPGFVPGKDLADANGRVAEFRETNIKLLKAIGADTIDAALARVASISGLDSARLEKLKAIDPAEYEALKAKAAKLKDKGVDDPDELDTKFKGMLTEALKPITEKLTASEAALAQERQRAAAATLRQTVAERFLKAKGKGNAVDIVVGLAGEAFDVVDGAVKAKPTRFSAEKAGQPLSLDEWLGQIAKDKDFLFEPSSGGGTTTSAGGGQPVKLPTTWKTPGGGEVKAAGIEVLS
jgi:hypothetical protein